MDRRPGLRSGWTLWNRITLVIFDYPVNFPIALADNGGIRGNRGLWSLTSYRGNATHALGKAGLLRVRGLIQTTDGEGTTNKKQDGTFSHHPSRVKSNMRSVRRLLCGDTSHLMQRPMSIA
jgi:hypothetical protein